MKESRRGKQASVDVLIVGINRYLEDDEICYRQWDMKWVYAKIKHLLLLHTECFGLGAGLEELKLKCWVPDAEYNLETVLIYF